MRVRAWLIAAVSINLAGVTTSFIADEYGDGDGGFPLVLRGVLVVLNFICLAVFVVKCWRWREADRARAQDVGQ